MDTISWLLDSDPALSWQAMRDLTDASPAAITAMRARVAHEGIGAEILASQGSDGSWRRDGAPVWLPTLFTLLLLRATGVDPADPAVESAMARLEAGLRWNDYPGRWDLRSRNSAPSPTRLLAATRAGTHSSKAKRSPASTGACSRWALTSDAPTRVSPVVSSASNSTMAVGTAKRRRAPAPRSTPRSACWRDCSSMSVP